MGSKAKAEITQSDSADSSFKQFLKDLVLFPVAFFFGSLFFLVVCLSGTWRLLVKIGAKIFKRKELGSFLSKQDLFFYGVDEYIIQIRPALNVTVLATIEGELDLEEFKTVLTDRVLDLRDSNGKLVYERLRQYPEVWLGFSFFKWEENFSVDKHVREIRDVDNAEGFVSKHFNTEFPSETSMWEICLLPQLGRTVMFLRFHHSLTDGRCILKLLQTRLLDTPEFPGKPPVSPEDLEKSGLSLKALLSFPRLLRRLRANKIPPSIVPDKTNTFQIHFAKTRSFPLEDFVQTKEDFDISFSLALVAAISKTVSIYVERYAKDKTKITKIGGLIFHPLAGDENKELANYSGKTRINFPIHEPDMTLGKLVETSKQALADASNSERSTNHKCLETLSTLGYYLPAEVFIKNFIPSRENVPCIFLSNMNGPKGASYILDNCISELMYWSPAAFPNPFLSFSSLSYGGYVRVGIMGAAPTIDSPEVLDELRVIFESQLQQILDVRPV